MKNTLKVRAEMLRIAGEKVDEMLRTMDYYKSEVVEFEESDSETRSEWKQEQVEGYKATIEAIEKLIVYLEKLAN